jgi:hypothetical protein
MVLAARERCLKVGVPIRDVVMEDEVMYDEKIDRVGLENNCELTPKRGVLEPVRSLIAARYAGASLIGWLVLVVQLKTGAGPRCQRGLAGRR